MVMLKRFLYIAAWFQAGPTQGRVCLGSRSIWIRLNAIRPKAENGCDHHALRRGSPENGSWGLTSQVCLQGVVAGDSTNRVQQAVFDGGCCIGKGAECFDYFSVIGFEPFFKSGPTHAKWLWAYAMHHTWWPSECLARPIGSTKGSVWRSLFL